VDSNVSAWTFGGSILSFAFPMILFIVVAATLYILYTKPEFIPGHPAPSLERPVSYTPVPGRPTAQRAAPAPAATQTATAETTTAETTEPPAAETTPGPAVETGDTE
jgi:hypothetical protein